MHTREFHVPSRRLIVGVVAAAAGSACGIGAPENTLVIAHPGAPDSMLVANYYAAKRGIPPTNVLYIDPAATNYASFASGNLVAFLGELEQRGIADHIDHVVITPGVPFFVAAPGLVSDGCSPVTRFAITTPFTLARTSSKILAGLASTSSNRYYSTSTTPTAFDASVGWLGGLASSDPNAERYFLCTMLGYSGENGNTIPEILAMIDRSVAADGTLALAPGGGGTFYFMDNQGDPARNVRAPQFPTAVNQLAAVGGTGQTIQAILPGGKHDILGIVTGAANPNIDGANMTILAGAFCDHLTSFAATFDTASQTKMSRWIAKGASGTSGTVEEPCNYLGKFPAPRLHVLYRQGMSLGEAWFRSQQFQPFQVLFNGDPLTRPWAHIPSVNVADAPAGPVSGTIQLTPSGTTTHPTASIFSFDLYIDGVLHSFTLPGLKFTLDTTALSDGVHDLRVVAYDSTPTKQPGRFLATLVVDNLGRSCDLVVANPAPELDDLVMMDLSGVSGGGGNIVEVRVRHQGRVVAAGPGSNASLGVFARHLGAGDSALQGEALFDDGSIVRSPVVPISVADSGSATSDAPVAFGYTRFVDPGQALVLELPSSHGSDLASAAYTLVSGPVKASVLGGSGPYRLLKPDADAAGADLVTFKVSTPDGESTGLVRIVYSLDCPGDCEGDADHDIFDFLCFQGKFATLEPYADFEGDGDWDVFDFLAFQDAASSACP